MLQMLVDLIIPPRRSELVVRGLTKAQVEGLSGAEGLPYHDPRVTALVWEVKYYGNRRAAALCGALLADQILACAADTVGRPLLIPVPMHPGRRRERGHNHTELLCEAALKCLQGTPVEYIPHALARMRATPTQQGLQRSVRLKNIKGAMIADEKAVRGRVCIVLDDVATTGATLAEARRALKAAGARSVENVVLARS
jgi:ComF family protein